MNTSWLYMLLAIATTAICWGVYGPVLHWGQGAMGNGRLRTFICVGLAYFVVAIVFPVVLMNMAKWETETKFHLNMSGFIWSFTGGALGAIGALGIILAFKFSPLQPQTTPLVVMPLVFGLAPVVNTLFQMTMNNTWGQISPFFAAGLILSAVGASTVLLTAPGKPKHGTTPAATHTSAPAPSSASPANAPSSSQEKAVAPPAATATPNASPSATAQPETSGDTPAATKSAE